MIQRRSKPKSSSHTISSRLLPELFVGFDPDDSLKVLDLGASSPKTIAYLTQFRSNVVIVDLLDTPELINPDVDKDLQDDEDHFDEAIRAWQQNINVAPDHHFDICLFWDLLNFLSPLSLEALSAALHPHVSHKTRGYGFGNLHTGADLPPQVYHILDSEHLNVAPADNIKPAYGHSQQLLNDHLSAFKVARATLLQEGRLELLFHAH